MMGDEGLTHARARAARRRDPRRLRARRRATARRRASRCCATSCCERSRRASRREGATEVAAVLRNLAERLGEFCGEGSYAYLLDRETTVPTDAPLVVFDTRRCPEIVLQPVMFALVEYVTARDRAPPRRSRATLRAPARRADVRRAHGAADRRGLAPGRAARDRRVRQRPRPPRPPPRPVPDRHLPAAVGLRRPSTAWRCSATPPCSCSSPSTRTSSPFVQDALRLSDEEAALIARLKTVKGSHSQVFWINGTRGKGRVSLRIGPREYWAYTSDPLRDVPLRDAAIARARRRRLARDRRARGLDEHHRRRQRPGVARDGAGRRHRRHGAESPAPAAGAAAGGAMGAGGGGAGGGGGQARDARWWRSASLPQWRRRRRQQQGAKVPAGDGMAEAGSRAVIGGLAAVAGISLMPLILIMLGRRRARHAAGLR